MVRTGAAANTQTERTNGPSPKRTRADEPPNKQTNARTNARTAPAPFERTGKRTHGRPRRIAVGRMGERLRFPAASSASAIAAAAAQSGRRRCPVPRRLSHSGCVGSLRSHCCWRASARRFRRRTSRSSCGAQRSAARTASASARRLCERARSGLARIDGSKPIGARALRERGFHRHGPRRGGAWLGPVVGCTDFSGDCG